MKMKKRHLLQRTMLAILIVLTAIPFPIAYANNEVYEGSYSPHNAVVYAAQYGDNYNPKYGIMYAKDADGYAVEEDCTYFVSQCLVAGGLPETEGWNSNRTCLWAEYRTVRGSKKKVWVGRGYNKGLTTFTNAGELNKYLANLGYRVEKSAYLSGNTLTVQSLNPAAGDVLQYDWDGDGTIDHSVLYCGIVNGAPVYSAHTRGVSMGSLRELEKAVRTPTASDGRIYGTVIYLIHMTDTTGLKDVTSRYIKDNHPIVALKSYEVNQYVSSDTDQNIATVDAVANRSVADTWEFFEVVPNQYGGVGFRSKANGNFLSAVISENSVSAPIRAAYGKDYFQPLTWESFRIFERENVLYIQSQANGKWLQVIANQNSHPLRAAAREASTWERFAIKVVG